MAQFAKAPSRRNQGVEPSACQSIDGAMRRRLPVSALSEKLGIHRPGRKSCMRVDDGFVAAMLALVSVLLNFHGV